MRNTRSRRQQILQLLRAAVDDRGVTVVMVTHDPLAAAVSDRLILLRAGRVVVDSATPDAATIARLKKEKLRIKEEMLGLA